MDSQQQTVGLAVTKEYKTGPWKGVYQGAFESFTVRDKGKCPVWLQFTLTQTTLGLNILGQTFWACSKNREFAHLCTVFHCFGASTAQDLGVRD